MNKNLSTYAFLAWGSLQLLAFFFLLVFVDDAIYKFAHWVVFSFNSNPTAEQAQNLNLRAFNLGAWIGRIYLWGIPTIPLLVIPWTSFKRRVLWAIPLALAVPMYFTISGWLR